MNALLTLLLLVLVVGLSMEFGILRTLAGVTVFALLVAFGTKYIRSIGTAPPEPTPEDVGDQDLRYVCTNCGLELRVERASGDRAPRHCGEPMELVRGDDPGVRPL